MGTNSYELFLYQDPYKSKFETEHGKGKECANYTLQEFQEEVSFKRKVNLFAKSDDLEVYAEP